MNEDIFQSLQGQKSNAKNLIQKASSFNWIDAVREQALIEKLENDTLTIGVIGQMKSGKSTFLNSFVFGSEVLPAATTPMTAALSVITYGAEKKIVAEFYNHDEWQELVFQSKKSYDDAKGNVLLESSIKAAKELVEKSSKLTDINALLGANKEDVFENLIEYVGADGSYVSITKSVTIYYSNEKLKGVEIVDTPGFNDPIVSREERTKEFLNKADVVLMMLYAGRPFDATDREIIFKHVGQCGMGKILIGINKYDIPYGNQEKENTIKQYVKDEIKKACQVDNNKVIQSILRDVEPIPVSSMMALLSQLDAEYISKSNELNHSHKRLSEIFNISTPTEFYQNSHIDILSTEIIRMIRDEKEQILFARPINSVLSSGLTKKSSLQNELYQQLSMIKNLNSTDDELEEKSDDLSRAERRVKKKIDGLSDELQDIFRILINSGSQSLQRTIDVTINDVKGKIENLADAEDLEKVMNQMNQQISMLKDREIPDFFGKFGRDVERKVKRCVDNFVNDVDDVFEKYLPEYDAKGLKDEITKRTNEIIEVQNSINVNDISFQDNRSGKEFWITQGIGFALNIIEVYITQGATSFASALYSGYENDRISDDLKASLEELSSKIQPRSIMEGIIQQGDLLIETVNENIIGEVLTPLKNQVKETKLLKENKEQVLSEAQERISVLQSEQVKLDSEITEIDNLKNIIFNDRV